MSRKKKFKDIWMNQTEIGKYFNVSSIEIGKKLIESGLRDPKTKKATERALKEEFATETPLKDGTYFCMWNKNKIISLFSHSMKVIPEEQRYINEAIKYKEEIDELSDSGQDKIAMMAWDGFYDQFPKKYHEAIRKAVEI